MYGKKMLVWAVVLPLLAQLSGLTGSTSIQPKGSKFGSNQLKIAKLAVYKYEGNQPYDVVAVVLDENGTLVKDAQVEVTSASFHKYPIALKSMGDGSYVGCDVEWVSAPSGSLVIQVQAEAKGMKTISAFAKDQRGNLCGEGEPQLHVSKPLAAKPDGEKQPLDIQVNVTDETGLPVIGAKVIARATDFNSYVDAPLSNKGGGQYLSCEFGRFNSKGVGAISIHVTAFAPGYRSAENDGSNKVGRICSPMPNTGSHSDNY